ncbi:CCA tRNA nucleotidyltransferase [Streptococcus sp. H49]|uniref:CCA tRNA nucleotidyltransferase n=1 Tax=Streptococcus huangxiaojuni TaxID=3237239 RepID=UPI0034A0D35B
MKLNALPSEFQEALPILNKIKKAGHQAYFVGGSVRDALLGRPIHDVDIATDAYPQEMKQLFPRTADIGIEHGTVLVLHRGAEYEVTTFRTEEAYVDYRRPSSVSFVRSLTEDLRRRDFTINALALDEEGEVIDHFAGLSDLKHGILRAVGEPSERFSEDALRIMRGFRFAASLNFQLEPATFTAMTACAPLLANISVERLFVECDKLFLSPYWKQGLKALIDSGAFTYLPGLQGKEKELLRLREELSDSFVFASSEQAWAFLILMIKPADSRQFLRLWKVSNQFQKTVLKLTAIYNLRNQEQLDKKMVYDYGRNLLLIAEGLREAQGLSVSFALIEELYQELPIYSKREIAVNGKILIKELGLKPGPALGLILDNIEGAVVAGQLDNTKSAIFSYIAAHYPDIR